MSQLVGKLSLFFDIQIHVDWQNGKLKWIQAGFKVTVAAQLLRLHLPELIHDFPPLWLRQTCQEYRQVVRNTVYFKE